MEQVIALLGARSDEVFFWGIHAQGELDLLIVRDGKRRGFEFKYSDAPSLSRSMELALASLGLHDLSVIYPGDQVFALSHKVRAIGLDALRQAL